MSKISRLFTFVPAILATLGLILPATAQTRPPAASTKAAAANQQADRQAVLQQRQEQQTRDGIRGVREQDQAARRTANQLNRDARLDAREQATAQATGQAQSQPGGNVVTTGQTNFQTNAALNANLRGADLGIWLTNPRGNTGLLVNDVAAQSLFAQAGLQEGDQIISINGRAVTTEAQFIQMLLAPGQLNQNQTATIVVLRNGQQQTLTIQPALLAQSVITADPFHQTGLIVDRSNPNQLVVQHVFPRTPAFYAGLRPGDVITGLNGQVITSIDALGQALTGAGGTDLALAVNRNGQTRQLTLGATGDASLRTALRPDTGTGIRSTAVGGATTTGAPAGIGITTGTDIDATTGAPGITTGTGINQTTTGVGVGGTGTGLGGVATGPIGTSNPAAGAITSPSAFSTPTAPSLTTQPGVGARTAVPGVRTAVPGLSPSGPSGASSLAPSATNQGGNITPSPAVSAFGSPTATGATGTTGGAGSTAGGIGATGGTGALPGGTGSTAGPSGGSTTTGTSGAGTGATSGTGAGTGGAGAGAGGAGASGT